MCEICVKRQKNYVNRNDGIVCEIMCANFKYIKFKISAIVPLKLWSIVSDWVKIKWIKYMYFTATLSFITHLIFLLEEFSAKLLM